MITGASRGIGAASARVFAQRGWEVSVHYSSSRDSAQALVRALAGLGARAACVQADVSRPGQAEDMVRQAEDGLGPLDAVVCNAGVALPQRLLTDTPPEEWRRLMSVDLDGMYYTLRAAIPGMVRRQRGAIVTVSSMWGLTGGSCEVPYSAAKAGVIGLTKALAKEVGPSGIRVNCVAPGVIHTEMNDVLSPDTLSALAEDTPLGVLGEPEDVGEAIAFLASEKARFITGQTLSPTGGFAL